MKKKLLSVLLCAGLTVSVLAGCGSDKSDAKADNDTKTESSDTESDMQYVKDKGTLAESGSDLTLIWQKHLRRALA